MPDSPIQDMLRPHLVQAVAMVRLLIEKWYEPPRLGALHMSTLVQQVLSMLAQYGGARAQDVWRCLCATGPFREVDQQMFGLFLRSLAAYKILTQSSDGTLLLDISGERIVNHYSFYAAFSTSEEFRLIAEGKLIGSLPIAFPVAEGSFLIFAGRRWEVMSVDMEHKVIQLKAALGGRAPSFAGSGGWVEDRVREEMFKVYTSTDCPAFLDGTARSLLNEGRKHFIDLHLFDRFMIGHGSNTLIFVWKGDRILNTLSLQLRSVGLQVAKDGLAIAISRKAPQEVFRLMGSLAEKGQADAISLVAAIKNKATEKHDRWLNNDIMNADYASRNLDCQGAWEAICRITKTPLDSLDTV